MAWGHKGSGGNSWNPKQRMEDEETLERVRMRVTKHEEILEGSRMGEAKNK